MLLSFIEEFFSQYPGYFNYLKKELLALKWNNYLFWIIGVSLLIWMLEIVFPWRKKQGIFRKDFWLDSFYMLVNFYLFNLILFVPVAWAAEHFFMQFTSWFGIDFPLFSMSSWPLVWQLIVFFLISDFVQWTVHILLHRVPFLWNFHKVHHSVKEMGFAAHMRFHPFETIFYKAALYVPIAATTGTGLEHIFIVHMGTIVIGHLNHANIKVDYGPLKYLFNNPKMHLWHHVKKLPKNHKYGVNFGISLSLWDYLFGTAEIPYEDPELELGFQEDEKFPGEFVGQIVAPFTGSTSENLNIQQKTNRNE